MLTDGHSNNYYVLLELIKYQERRGVGGGPHKLSLVVVFLKVIMQTAGLPLSGMSDSIAYSHDNLL